MDKKISRLLQPGIFLTTLVLLICAAVAFFSDFVELAILEAGAALLLLLVSQLDAVRKRKAITQYMQSTVHALDVSLRSESPFPKFVLNLETNEIIWSSKKFSQLLGLRDELYHRKLSTVLPELDLGFLTDNSKTLYKEFSYQGHRYHVFGTVFLPREAEPAQMLSTIYLIDMTEFLNVKDEYARSRPVVSLLLIDNYDELTGNLSDTDVSKLSIAINNAIMGWVEGLGGMLRRVERNRYLFIFEAKDLQKMIDGKFSLLEQVRGVVNGSGLAATLSIGIGKDGATFEESYNFAALSIEMALSRGGDQAVVKDRYNFSFYGGRNKESASRSKVKSRVMANSLSELIAQSSHVFIMGHKNADLDAIGAAAGIMCLCRKRGKHANIVLDLAVNAAPNMIAQLCSLDEYKDCFITGEEALIRADPKSLLIVVDTNRPDQVEYKPLLASMSRVAVIDHHRRAADYIEGVILNLHEPFASSTSELVSELLQYAVEPTDVLPLEARALLAGIVLDTKRFSVRTSSRTFDAAAFLRRLGADTVDVKKLFQNDLTATVARYQIIQKARIYRQNIAICALDYTANRTIAAQASDELLDIAGIMTSFVLYPDENRVIVSARSIGDANVQLILEPLGGGGNPATAGAQITGKTMKQVLDELISSIDKFFE